MEINYEISTIALHTAGTLYVASALVTGVAQLYLSYRERKSHGNTYPSLDSKLTEDSKARDH